ncbi:MAG: DUF5316 family protein [Bacillota bacterium]|uniref:Uncharacterized protein n=1 Tax=Virgibacillus salarius TaxID=447199 RepID=A0A941DQA4_9BACI|nr:MULTISPECIES: DUF5316 family protein [Bacillaceae]NAZ07699.1 hypothetical protein [Agaribacter marinus]MBR7794979.1 hypothetical protein [Virgibacillus salarius]MCC2252484.1 DUF5316 domain-containing protein [Virgibacillus sp. AGTR]MDY7046084.1 DUF5316 family protein [Virgibacillus sp. M23]QRZ18738.1 hypothetical protein JUJ52_03045 [Virgibacillus sp. AGTR]
MLTILAGIGLVGIVISGIFLGVFTSGQQQRANYHSETREHYAFRTKIGLYCGSIGLVFLGIAGLIWYF